ncbi:MAG: UDP-N-acetyl-D-glucosamine 2-epimerase, UDP-hydrolysing [Candidatus Portnoybacteria bacterium RBG_13_40_8]|uniref:UDP-N-acetyl-D-glucosamine 2-epimerase, UDP-hydrolysing n=1 Tax=Candidatus Portnoybacteria bacterium RBG_13_40_8 TaxID=1801990 RepID=A0A1G2F5M2_9BACT|nr:MAG: UDP-N-acetyl-D-glucosamine 2-epimerase, UDP-hydrolysing [Candidatus Portnoybacteria bacterium RBG_13_40_8]
MNQTKKRKICFVITSTIHYARSKLILVKLKKRDDVDLQIVIGGSAILSKYGEVDKWLKHDGLDVSAVVSITLEGGNNVSMAKTAGLGVIEFTSTFEKLKPDIVVLRADRYEVLSAAIAAAYLNIPIAHIEGGDVSGNIDESVRHAITKLAHIHFATNEDSKKRIIQMGERPDYVFNVGCPGLEIAAKNNFKITNRIINNMGLGARVDINKNFLIVTQHPVTTEIEMNEKNIIETIKSISELNIPTIWFWPNVDAGTDRISGMLRRYREKHNLDRSVLFIKFLLPEEFISLLKKTSCLVGNSSAGIKECSYLKIPVVNIGTRQDGRMRAENVIDVDYDRRKIKKAILKQISHGPYPSSDIYYKPNSSKKIVDILSNINLYIQKKFNDDNV